MIYRYIVHCSYNFLYLIFVWWGQKWGPAEKAKVPRSVWQRKTARQMATELEEIVWLVWASGRAPVELRISEFFQFK